MPRAIQTVMDGLALTTLCVLAVTADAQSQAGAATDREQINGLLARWEDAWNTHDMASFASIFHEDGVWILWTGDVWKGRRAIEEGHVAAHKSVFRNSTQREAMSAMSMSRRFNSPGRPIRGRGCSALHSNRRPSTTA